MGVSGRRNLLLLLLALLLLLLLLLLLVLLLLLFLPRSPLEYSRVHASERGTNFSVDSTPLSVFGCKVKKKADFSYLGRRKLLQHLQAVEEENVAPTY